MDINIGSDLYVNELLARNFMKENVALSHSL